MNRSAAGGGTFDGVYQAFHDECNRYAKQKKIKISRKTVRAAKVEVFNETVAKEMTSEGFENLLDEIDVFIFGADGLCWLRDGVITDAANLVNFLIEERKEVFILTNDTTNSQESHEKKLRHHRFNPKLDKVSCRWRNLDLEMKEICREIRFYNMKKYKLGQMQYLPTPHPANGEKA
ncbi:unnamed protein product [Cylicostephanus goldi]|uniref:Uncharacterized protein n=1 Tax=Cylicostephanus goldi TaxID=71465 RepID=A0A3P7RA90_CYLGO|nr:unnamed protein product [Cylicostephanus goldi]